MSLWTKLLFLLPIISVTSNAQQVVRITEPNAINPAEVSIAINPKNPDNMIAASDRPSAEATSRQLSLRHL